MSDAVTNAPAATAVAESPVAIAAAKAEKEKASAEKWAAEAVKAMEAKERKAPKEEPESEPKKADKAEAKEKSKDGKEASKEAHAKEKPRGPDGKFLPESGKGASGEKPGQAVAATGDAGKHNGKAGQVSEGPDAGTGEKRPGDDGAEAGSTFGGLGKARRLVREGKVAEALKLIELDPEKITNSQWKAWRHENAKKEAALRADYEAFERHKAEARAEVKAVTEKLRKYAEAEDAITSGDDEKAFQLLWGKDLNSWQREQLAKLHSGARDLRRDPVVSELKAENDKLRSEFRQYQERLEKERHEAEVKRVQVEYREKLTERLANSGDAQLERASRLPWFVRMVHKERLDAYNEETDTTITEDEAIERCFDEDRLTAKQWRELTGEEPGQRDPGTQTRATTDPRGNEAKRQVRPVTSLSRSATVEAAPERRRTPEESLKHWSSIGQKLADEGKFGRGKAVG